MYYRFSDDYEVCSYQGLPCLCRNKKTNTYIPFSQDVPRILLQCKGEIDIDQDTLSDTQKMFLRIGLEIGMLTESAQPNPMDGPITVKYFANKFRKSAQWSITGHCNYKCKHCFQYATEGVLGEPTLEQCMDVIHQLTECGIHEVIITGGEPLIRKDFWQIVDALAAADIRIIILYTNGALVTQELLDGLSSRGMHPKFEISFDGVGFHDWFRGVPHAEENAIRAMKLLAKNGFTFECAMCLCTKNMHVIANTAEFLASIGCSTVMVSRAHLIGHWKEHRELAIPDDEIRELYMRFAEEYYEKKIPVPMSLEGTYSLRPVDKTPIGEKPVKVELDRHCPEEKTEHVLICGTVGRSFIIGADGTVVPCMSMGSARIAEQFPNIFRMPLKKILSDSSYITLSETKIADVIRANEKCVNCEYRLSCHGGRCRIQACGDEGTNYLAAWDSMCQMYKSGLAGRLIAFADELNRKLESDRVAKQESSDQGID